MKLSAKKKGQLYDLIHFEIREKRIEIQNNYMVGIDEHKANTIDYQIAQLEIPLAHRIFELLEGK